MLASLSGKLLMWGTLKKIVQKNLKYLVTFAIGVFSATLYLMLKESVHLESSIASIAIAASLGALSLEILQRIVPEAHHHHGSNKDECCEHTHEKKINPRRILLGDAAHNMGDGILLVPAFLLDFHIGLTVTVGILLHEIVQEISEFFLLIEAGYSAKRALISNFIVSSTILIGVIIAIFISAASSYSHLLIAFSAGGIMYIIVRDLLPHTIERVKHDGGAFKHIIAAILGLSIMLVTVQIIPHSHDLHEGHQHESEIHLYKNC